MSDEIFIAISNAFKCLAGKNGLSYINYNLLRRGVRFHFSNEACPDGSIDFPRLRLQATRNGEYVHIFTTDVGNLVGRYLEDHPSL